MFEGGEPCQRLGTGYWNNGTGGEDLKTKIVPKSSLAVMETSMVGAQNGEVDI